MKIIYVILLFGFAPALAQNRGYDTLPNLPEHYVSRYEQFKKEPANSERVIMVGNSITEGGQWKILLKDTSILNRGIGGDVTFGVLNRLKEITDRKPSKVFLLIGINDLSRNTPDEVIIENIFTIVSKIRSSSRKTAVYVQSIFPLNETFKNLNKNFVGKGEHVSMINRQLKKHAKKLKYTYVDLYSEFTDAEGRLDAKYATDGLHLSPAGYVHWVEILKRDKHL